VLSPGEVIKQVRESAGILLSGGCDIHPSLYGRMEDLPFCRDIDPVRDSLELAIIELALMYKIPLLGICRGAQILNVAMKGSLIADIRAIIPESLNHSEKDKDAIHEVRINRDSALYRLTGLTSGNVNSSHHQSVNLIAPGFVATAFSADEVIEAIESNHHVEHPFCLAVQWHPERMELKNPLSGKLGLGFIAEARKKEAGSKS
jgi:putative glutamine amidotransferase